ncbi:putative repeat protein (TIGR04042 family) [Primorskyibacter sedentarius]|uniref:Putative repeat protein (TIGR04042 family) n=1 Tax=Primorskyibacter sedentarius TaxID=745311 RepID=A0A4R3JLI1_9RHOB|nr:MSMEG_0570 family nitrogen starvation response protein [Primorskyibacter sedentarius]TCS67186.1 putative repeat protein (TIGR04042 family) [Primorskyibacter sedentarius]
MPETFWTVRWPDGREEQLYSPSTVVAELFTPGTSYPLSDFQSRARVALERASDRVARKYGFACSSAMEQLDRIEARIAEFDMAADGPVICLKIT